MGDKLRCIAFYSARTARHFMTLTREANLLEALKNTKALCISAGVLECVQPEKWMSTHVAKSSNGEAMMGLMIEHGRTLCDKNE